MKVLLVEDDKHLANMYSKRFTKEGWGTVICHDGAGALTKLEAENFDLIILDVMLPGMSGIDVLQLLRQNLRTTKVPIVIYTNYGGHNKEKCLTYGADEFILKIDSTPESLTTSIKGIIDKVKTGEKI